jgi:hypothetical protein
MPLSSPVFRRAVGLLVPLALLAGAGSLAAAQPRYLLDQPGTWKPWKFTATPSARQEHAATAAEVKAFEAELLGLQAILRRAAAVAPPKGFSVETWGNLNGYGPPSPGQPPGQALPLSGALSFGAFPIFEYERGGKTIREDSGETELMSFHVNELQPWLTAGAHVDAWNDFDTDAFLMPRASGDVSGFPRYGDVILIKKNQAPIWAPVSLEEALRITAAAQARDVEQKKEVVARFQTQLDDLRNPAKRAARWEEHKKNVQQMADGAAFLATMEKAEQAQDASLVRELSANGGVMKTFLDAERAAAETRAWADSLTPAARTAQACYAGRAGALRERFRSGDAAGTGCVPIVRPNWLYFNKALPRSAPQVILVSGAARCVDRASEPRGQNTAAGCPANRQLLQTMDRQAVLDWLK